MCYFYRRIFEELMWKVTENPELKNLIGHYHKYVEEEKINFIDNLI
jgi:hypothetical protein